MPKMGKFFRADQIGSLLRPPELLDARDACKAGRISMAQLRAVEDQSILTALAMQCEVGLEIFSDGEMRRDAWQTNVSQAVEGFEAAYPVRESTTPDGRRVRIEMHAKGVERKLRQIRRIAQVDAAFMREHSPGPFKITMPSPAAVARAGYRRGVTEKAYPRREELHRDLADIIRGEMQALVADGAGYLQLDEGFNSYVNEDWRAQLRAQGLDPQRSLELDIAVDNSCYDAVAGSGVTRAMHLCRGSRTSWEHGSGGYQWLAERLLGALHVDRFLLEYDSALVGGFEPLRFVPKGKVVVLGLVSSKNPRLETIDELRRKIDEAAKYCPLEQLAISTQCGFQGAADRDGAHMTIDEQRRKLELVVETARQVWG
ncbi:MAG TPA: hypothetical protein VKV28_02220 [Candidatus Binataceae bacterium]|nr:hypothetical protein [Candidatus Binataceae bacterium]